MDGHAVSRFVRISPSKTRLVADLIRGKRVDQALYILSLTPKKASPILRKALLAAVANARVKSDEDVRMPESQMVVSEVRIDPGPTMKRIRPRAQGRAYRILKRTSHIQVRVTQAR